MTALRGTESSWSTSERGDGRAEDWSRSRSTARPRSSLAERSGASSGFVGAALLGVLAGCGDGEGRQGEADRLRQRAAARGAGGEGRAVVDGARLALAQAGGSVGDFSVRAGVTWTTPAAAAAGTRWRAPPTRAGPRRTRPRSGSSESSTRARRGSRCRSPTRPRSRRSRPGRRVRPDRGALPHRRRADLRPPRPQRSRAGAGRIPIAARVGVAPARVAVGAPDPATPAGCGEDRTADYLISPTASRRDPLRAEPPSIAPTARASAVAPSRPRPTASRRCRCC